MVIDAWTLSSRSSHSYSGTVRSFICTTAICGNKEMVATLVEWKTRPLENVFVDLQSFLDHRLDSRHLVFLRG